MVMPSKYRCSSCGIEFTGSDAIDFPILCERCILRNFVEKIEKNSKDMPPEFIDVVNKHFWKLI
jgi:DNA-directed RNA polymerase subunit RPC12/RpoP